MCVHNVRQILWCVCACEVRVYEYLRVRVRRRSACMCARLGACDVSVVLITRFAQFLLERNHLLLPFLSSPGATVEPSVVFFRCFLLPAAPTSH